MAAHRQSSPCPRSAGRSRCASWRPSSTRGERVIPVAELEAGRCTCMTRTWESSPSLPCCRSLVSARPSKSTACTGEPTACAAMPSSHSAAGSDDVLDDHAVEHACMRLPGRAAPAPRQRARRRSGDRRRLRSSRFGDLGDPGARSRPGIRPPAAQRGAEQQVQRQVGVARRRRFCRDAAQSSNTRPASPGTPSLKISRSHSILARSSRDRLVRAALIEQLVDQVGAAEPERVLGGEQQPPPAPGRVRGQLRGAFKRPDRAGRRAAPQRDRVQSSSSSSAIVVVLAR